MKKRTVQGFSVNNRAMTHSIREFVIYEIAVLFQPLIPSN